MFDFNNFSAESKYYDDSNKLSVGKMKDETGSVVIKEFVGLKPKISSEDKKGKGVINNIIATISHDECKNVLFN